MYPWINMFFYFFKKCRFFEFMLAPSYFIVLFWVLEIMIKFQGNRVPTFNCSLLNHRCMFLKKNAIFSLLCLVIDQFGFYMQVCQVCFTWNFYLIFLTICPCFLVLFMGGLFKVFYVIFLLFHWGNLLVKGVAPSSFHFNF